MIGKMIVHIIVFAILGGIAASGMLIGLLAISDQYVDAAGWHGEYTGRGAVFFGVACFLAGLAFLCFYISTLFASKLFIMMGIGYIISTFGIGRVAGYVPDFVLDQYVVPRVQDIVNTHIRPILELVGW
jgi:hypothetical protein